MKTLEKVKKTKSTDVIDVTKSKKDCESRKLYFFTIRDNVNAEQFINCIKNYMKYNECKDFEQVFDKDAYKKYCFMNAKLLDKIIARTYYNDKYSMSMNAYICMLKDNKFATFIEDVHIISKRKENEFIKVLQKKYAKVYNVSDAKIFFDFSQYYLYLFFSFDYIVYCKESKKIIFVEYKNKKNLYYVVKSNVIQYAIFYELIQIVNNYLAEKNEQYSFAFAVANDEHELFLNSKLLYKQLSFDTTKLSYYIEKFYKEYFCTIEKFDNCVDCLECYNYAQNESELQENKINVLENKRKIIYKDKTEKNCIIDKYITKIIV